jgi:hypothetical protein
VLAARRPPLFTPPKRASAASDEAIGDSEPNESGEPREGVA